MMSRCAGYACKRHRDDGTRRKLEQEQFKGEENCCYRTAKNRRHTSGGSGGQEYLSFMMRDPHQLPQRGAKGTAGGDDRSFSTKWSTGANRNGGGDGL